MRSWVRRAMCKAASAARVSDAAASADRRAASSAAEARTPAALISRASSRTSGAPSRTRSPGRTSTSTIGAITRLAITAVERARTTPPASTTDGRSAVCARPIVTGTGGASAFEGGGAVAQPAAKRAATTDVTRAFSFTSTSSRRT